MAAVTKQPIDIRQAAQKGPCADIVADVSGGHEQVERTPLAVAESMKLRVHPALWTTPSRDISFGNTLLGKESGVHAPLFDAHAGRGAVGFEISCVDHHSLFLAMLGSSTHHHLRKDALFVVSLGAMAFNHSPPPRPTVVQRLVWPISGGCVTPP